MRDHTESEIFVGNILQYKNKAENYEHEEPKDKQKSIVHGSFGIELEKLKTSTSHSSTPLLLKIIPIKFIYQKVPSFESAYMVEIKSVSRIEAKMTKSRLKKQTQS